MIMQFFYSAYYLRCLFLENNIRKFTVIGDIRN